MAQVYNIASRRKSMYGARQQNPNRSQEPNMDGLFPPAYDQATESKCPEELYEFLLHPDRHVRMAAIRNRHTPSNYLIDALNQEQDTVACALALERLCLRPTLHDCVPSYIGLALQRTFPDEGGDGRKVLNECIARFCRGTEVWNGQPILQWLYETGEWMVYIVLVNRRDCPQDLLNKLASLPVVPVKSKLSFLPDMYQEIRELALKRGGRPRTPAANGNGK
jgi:hypothetical protein